jgi:hypothetical protein
LDNGNSLRHVKAKTFNMKEHKMTKWDAGQALVKCAECLQDHENDLKDGGFTDQSDIVKNARLKIGSAFNKMQTDVFRLPSLEQP